MEPSPPESFDRESTLGLLGIILRCSIMVPVVAFGMVYGYFLLEGAVLERADWKRVFFILWLGTLCSMAFFALRYRRPRSRQVPQSPLSISESRSPMDKWEQRSSRRLLREVYLAAIAIPLLACGLALGYFYAIGQTLSHAELKMIILCGWLSCLVVAVRLAWRSKKTKLLD